MWLWNQLEPTGTYGDAIRGLFETHKIPVYRVSTKRVHDSAEVFDGVPSLHDAKAAYQIGRLHPEGISRFWEKNSEKRRALTAQINLIKLYKERIKSSGNRLEAYLARHWPELPRILDLHSVTAMTLITTLGSPSQVATCEEYARHLMCRLNQETIDSVIDSAKKTIGIPCIEAECLVIQTLACDMLEHYRTLQKIEQTLATQVEADPTAKQMASVIGKTSAAVLLSSLDKPQTYPNASSYLKSLGLISKNAAVENQRVI